MSRLTWRQDGEAFTNYLTKSVVDKLADYEDKQEQGLLIKLKAKIGDTVYTAYGEEVESDIVGCIEILSDKIYYRDRHGSLIGSEPFVFLTYSEAEEALAKMGGK